MDHSYFAGWAQPPHLSTEEQQEGVGCSPLASRQVGRLIGGLGGLGGLCGWLVRLSGFWLVDCKIKAWLFLSVKGRLKDVMQTWFMNNFHCRHHHQLCQCWQCVHLFMICMICHQWYCRCGDFEAFNSVSWWYNYHTFPEIYLVRISSLTSASASSSLQSWWQPGEARLVYLWWEKAGRPLGLFAGWPTSNSDDGDDDDDDDDGGDDDDDGGDDDDDDKYDWNGSDKSNMVLRFSGGPVLSDGPWLARSWVGQSIITISTVSLIIIIKWIALLRFQQSAPFG